MEPTHFPFKESKFDRWGLVDARGKVLIEDEFENEITPVLDGVFYAETKGGFEMYSIDNPKNPIGDIYKDIAYFSDGLAPSVKANEGIKYIDKKGNVKFELPLEYLRATRFLNGYSLIARKGPDDFWEFGGCSWENLIWDVVSSKGEIMKFKDFSVEYPFPNGDLLVYSIEIGGSENECTYGPTKDFYIIKSNGTKVQLKDFVNSYCILQKWNSELLISPDIKYYVYLYSNYSDYGCSNVYGIKDVDGKIIIKAKYKDLRFLNDGNIVFYNDDNDCGIMNIKEDVLIRPKYTSIREFGENKYIVDRDGKTGLITIKGDRIIDFEYDSLYGLSEKTLLATSRGQEIELITSDGKTLTYFHEIKPAIIDFNYVESDYLDVKDLIKTILYQSNHSINDFHGFIGKTPRACITENPYLYVFLDYGIDDVDEDNNWLISKKGFECFYGTIKYSYKFDKVIKVSYDPYDYFKWNPKYSFTNNPCKGILIELSLKKQYCNKGKIIYGQLESVVQSLDDSFRVEIDGVNDYHFENDKVKVSFMVESNKIKCWAALISDKEFPSWDFTPCGKQHYSTIID